MDIYFSQSIIKWTVHPLNKNTTLILERKSVFSYFVWFRYLEIAHSNLWKISFCSGTRNKINSMRYFCVSTCSYNTVLTSFQRNLLLFSLGNLEKTFRNQFVTLNKNKKWFYWIASFNMFIVYHFWPPSLENVTFKLSSLWLVQMNILCIIFSGIGAATEW